MEQDKKKILSDLYAIRATMSLIAENDDSADPERKEIRECKHSVWTLMDDIEKKKKSTRTELSAFTIDKRINELNDELEEIEKHCANEKQEYYSETWDAKKNFFVRFFRCWGRCLLLFGDFTEYHWLLIIPFWPLYLIWMPVSVPVSIIMAMYIKKTAKQSAKFHEEKMKQCENQMARISTEIKALTDKRNTGEVWIACREVTAAQQRMRDFEEETNQQISAVKQKIPIHQSAIQAIAKKSQAIIDSATKAYPLIDFRDWENVDLLIYYFETGRADDMKEALQLVDRQRQTEMLAKAIAMASAEICKTIHQSMNQLGNALAQSFSMLSSQMAQQHLEMLREMEEQAAAQREASEEQLKEIRAQTAAQLASQAMNRALLEKISDSSLDLAYQMNRQMREVHGIPV